MKKGVKITGLIVLIVALIIGALFFLDKYKDNNSVQGDNEFISPDEQTEYVGESTTLLHKDFKAVIKKDWQEFEITPSMYFYFPPNTAEEDVNAEVIYIAITPLGKDSNFTLDTLLEQGIENSKSIMPDFELTENIDKTDSEVFERKIKFTGTQEGVKRDNVQVFGIRYNNIYSVTYSCPIDNCNNYAVYNGLVESFEAIEAK